MIETILTNIKSIAIFAVFLGVLISVHEWGHFITAKKLGVDVETFAIGFGPRLLSRVYNGTEYALCLFPLGGYVKMAGDEKMNCKGDPGEFYSKPVGHRALIVLNGPVVNFILAYLSLILVFMIGFPDLSTKIGKLIENYPAQVAGVKEGDTLLTIDGVALESWTDVQDAIKESKGREVALTLLRDGNVLEKTIVPKREESENLFGEVKERKIIGIQPAEDIIYFKYDFFTAVKKGHDKFVEVTFITYKAIYRMLFGKMSARDNMGGPVLIYTIVQTAAQRGFSDFMLILGIISLNLAIFNLLPVIPLDGGHLFLLAIEKVRGKGLSAKTDEYIARVGLSLIILLALFLFYVDFERIGLFEKIKDLFS